MNDLFARWPYVTLVDLTDDISADAVHFLYANGKQKTASHCIDVAETSERLAVQFGLNSAVVRTAAMLHDISAVIKPDDMYRYAVAAGWDICEAERRYPFILHQRMSAVIAEGYFHVNEPLIISAITCHSTLKSNPSDYDMLLYLADKLAWDQEGEPPYRDIINDALTTSLAHASFTLIAYLLDNHKLLYPHTWLMEAMRSLKSEKYISGAHQNGLIRMGYTKS